MNNPIYPCLWFDGNGKEAADLYCSVFPDSHIISNTPLVVNFSLGGQKIMALNGGPHFKINPSISFFVVCESVKELDEAWQALSEGGQVLMSLDKYKWSEKYGWVSDRFGVSWQLSYGKLEDVGGQKITPSLMYTQEKAGKAEEAINYYTTVFRDSSVEGILRYTAEDPDVEGTVKHAQFQLGKTVFMAMDSSLPHNFKFGEGVSLVVECGSQEEIDYFWNTFTAEGEESMCGWLKDKYGVSWQIIPGEIGKWMSDPSTSKQVSDELMKMRKIEIEPLVRAYERK